MCIPHMLCATRIFFYIFMRMAHMICAIRIILKERMIFMEVTDGKFLSNKEYTKEANQAYQRSTKRLEILIKQFGTQTKLGEAIHRDQASISRIKNGSWDFTSDILREIAINCGVSTDWLLGLENAQEFRYQNQKLSYYQIASLLLDLQRMGILCIEKKGGLTPDEDGDPSYDVEPYSVSGIVEIEDPIVRKLMEELQRIESIKTERIKQIASDALLSTYGKMEVVDWTKMNNNEEVASARSEIIEAINEGTFSDDVLKQILHVEKPFSD